MSHADIILVGELLDQMMIMGRKESSAFDIIGELFDYTVSDGGAVKSSRPAAQFVHENQRMFGGVVQNRRRLAQLQKECTLSLQDFISGADSGEYPVDWGQAAAFRRHVTTLIRV